MKNKKIIIKKEKKKCWAFSRPTDHLQIAPHFESGKLKCGDLVLYSKKVGQCARDGHTNLENESTRG